MKTVERDIIVIGASAGGSNAIPGLIGQLPSDIPAAIFVVMHFDSSIEHNYLEKLIRKSGFSRCRMAKDGDIIEYGWVYIAPPDHHLLLRHDKMMVVRGPKENGFRPSIDMLFRSAAAHFDGQVVGVLLTGMLDDGTAGLGAIQRSGGLAVVQDPKDAEYPDMPEHAIAHNQIRYVQTIEKMGALLLELISEPSEQIRVPIDVQREANIAERIVTNIDKTSELGAQIPFSRPDCGGSLWEIPDESGNRFRCHTGHAYSEDGLIRKQSKALEESLWVALRMLEERKHLLKKFVLQLETSNRKSASALYHERLDEIEKHITQIRGVLNSDEIYSGLKSSLTS